MIRGDKELYVVGDRVLIRIDDMEERTAVGLYLPPDRLGKGECAKRAHRRSGARRSPAADSR